MNQSRVKDIEEKLDAMQRVCKRLEAGETGTQVCREEGVDYQAFRRICDGKLFSDGGGNEADVGDWLLSPAERIWVDTYEKAPMYMIPEDVEETLDFILKDFEPRLRDVLKYRYYDGMKQYEIAEKLGVRPERARALLSKCFRLLRHPDRAKYFRYGKKWYDTYEKERKRLREEAYAKIMEEKLSEERVDTECVGDTVDVGDLPIIGLGLSYRTANLMYKQGVRTLGEFMKRYPTRKDVRSIRGLGNKALNELVTVSKNLGVDWL